MTGKGVMDNTIFDADELLALARHDLERGQLDQALHRLKRLVGESDPKPEALVLAGRLYAQLGLSEHAQRLFEKYLMAKPDAVHETFELGMTYFDSGKVEKALEMWAKVLVQQPTYPPALFYNGLASARDGKLTDAKRNLDILLKSAPADNLYFTKGKDLLREIDQALIQADQVPPAAIDAFSKSAPSYFSKTEH